MTTPRRPEWTSYAARRRVVDDVPVIPTLHLIPESGAPMPLCGVDGPFTDKIGGDKEICRECAAKYEELHGRATRNPQGNPTPGTAPTP